MKAKKAMSVLMMSAMVLSTLVLGGCKTNGPSVFTPTSETTTATTDASAIEPTGGVTTGDVELNTDGIVNYNQYLQILNTVAESEDANAVYSPVSLNTALYLYANSVGDSNIRNEIFNFTHGIDYLSYRDFSSPEEGEGIYRIVNRVWFNTNLDFDSEAFGIAAPYMFGIDMSDPSATDVKNAYVNEQTNGFIPQTPTIFTNDIVVDFMNIVYFKDHWLGGNLTMTGDNIDFCNSDGSTSSIPMMMYSNGYYYENDTCYVIPMRYSLEGMTFYAIYPKGDMSAVNFDGLFENEVRNPVDIKLPEFEASATMNISDYTSQIGLPHFGPTQLLFYNQITPASISQVVRIRVDHEGTEAAAVTEINVTNSSCENEPIPLVLTFDKPFYYMITDVNGDAAFVGRIMHVD